jgi:hypothetical protein
LKEKGEAASSLGNVSALLGKIDPHKMCELEAAIKLHGELIAKLEKMQSSLLNGTIGSDRREPAPPTQKSGMGAEDTRKFIREYISNMDLETRIKNSEKSITEFGKRVDCITDLEKKLHAFTKEFDFGSLSRELGKKCNSDETRK